MELDREVCRNDQIALPSNFRKGKAERLKGLETRHFQEMDVVGVIDMAVGVHLVVAHLQLKGGRLSHTALPFSLPPRGVIRSERSQQSRDTGLSRVHLRWATNPIDANSTGAPYGCGINSIDLPSAPVTCPGWPR